MKLMLDDLKVRQRTMYATAMEVFHVQCFIHVLILASGACLNLTEVPATKIKESIVTLRSFVERCDMVQFSS